MAEITSDDLREIARLVDEGNIESGLDYESLKGEVKHIVWRFDMYGSLTINVWED